LNLISSDDFSKEQINRIFEIADSLNAKKEVISLKEHTLLTLLYQNSSIRIKFPLEIAISQLGGIPINIDMKEWKIDCELCLQDLSKFISSCSDFMAVSLDNHSDMVKLANNSNIPVINMSTNLEQPIQALSDIYTIKEAKRGVKGIKTAFVGGINSGIVNSFMLFGAKLGMEIALVGAKNQIPNSFYFNKAREFSKVDKYEDIEEGFSDSDVLYALPFDSAANNNSNWDKIISDYQLNNNHLKYANKNALIMRSILIRRNEEISDEVIESSNIIEQQIKNNILIGKALLIYLSGTSEIF
jgi:ornithine carbamoyltransferase